MDETYAESALATPGEYALYVQQIVGFNTELAEDQQMSYILTIEEGETTAIDAVDAEAENAVIYDLTGRRVEKITKAGVYVINGVKKVVK